MENSNGIRKAVDFVLWTTLFILILKWWNKISPKERIGIKRAFLFFLLSIIIGGTFCKVSQDIAFEKIIEKRESRERERFGGKTEDEYITDYQNSTKYLCGPAIADVISVWGEEVKDVDDPHHDEYVKAEENCNNSINKDTPIYNNGRNLSGLITEEITACIILIIIILWLYNLKIIIRPDSAYQPEHPEDQPRVSQS